MAAQCIRMWVGLVAVGVIVAATPDPAAGQAMTPPKGEGSLSFVTSDFLVTDHLGGEGQRDKAKSGRARPSRRAWRHIASARPGVSKWSRWATKPPKSASRRNAACSSATRVSSSIPRSFNATS